MKLKSNEVSNPLMKTFPSEAEELFVATERNAKLRYEGYKKLSEM